MTLLWCFIAIWELDSPSSHTLSLHRKAHLEKKILFMEEMMIEVSLLGELSLYGLESMRKQNG